MDQFTKKQLKLHQKLSKIRKLETMGYLLIIIKWVIK